MKPTRILGLLACLLAPMFVSITPAGADVLYANQELTCGSNMYSDNGYYRLYCGSVGFSPYNFLAWRYQGPGTPQTIWSSRLDSLSSGLGTHTDQWAAVDSDARAYMQENGEFALYNNSFSNQVWSTASWNNYDARLNLQDDGNLIVYTSSWVPVWSVF